MPKKVSQKQKFKYFIFHNLLILPKVSSPDVHQAEVCSALR